MGKTRLPTGFVISDDMRLWASEKTPRVDIDAEHEKFMDYFKACGKSMADWEATWRNWMRRCLNMGGARKPLPSADEIEAREKLHAAH